LTKHSGAKGNFNARGDLASYRKGKIRTSE